MKNAIIIIKDLKQRIADCHRGVEAHGKIMLESARDAGQHLITVRKEIPHGQWETWVTENCPFTPRTASRYVMVCDHWDEIKPKLEGSSVASVSGALKLIEKPAKSDTVSDLDIEGDEKLPKKATTPAKTTLQKFKDLVERVDAYDRSRGGTEARDAILHAPLRRKKLPGVIAPAQCEDGGYFVTTLYKQIRALSAYQDAL